MTQQEWHSLLTKIGNDQGAGLLASVLRQTKIVSADESTIVVSCENQGVELYLQKRKNDAESLLSRHLPKPVTIEFGQKQVGKKDAPAPLLQFTPSGEDMVRRAGLNIKYKFDNFAVFSSNQIAYAAAQAISQNPGVSYNPLFLWGGVGVGKTHLAQAVARTVLERDPEKRILFCPGDNFTNDLVEAIRGKTTPRFRRKYRNLDVLIIDDIQFIAGKVSIQEELFHTFNTIVSQGGQIILTSDKPPSELKSIEDRLRSRFSGGLIVDIQPPDFELRTAILLIKAKEKNILIDIEAAKVIAEQVGDTRALEGTLLSIGAQIWGKKERIDLEAIDEYFSGVKEKKQTKKQPKPADIIRAAATFYDLKPSHIRGTTRTEHLARARQIVMYILREEFDLKLEEIAFILKKKDHTTILYGVNKIKSLAMKDPGLKGEIETIVQTVLQST